MLNVWFAVSRHSVTPHHITSTKLRTEIEYVALFQTAHNQIHKVTLSNYVGFQFFAVFVPKLPQKRNLMCLSASCKISVVYDTFENLTLKCSIFFTRSFKMPNKFPPSTCSCRLGVLGCPELNKELDEATNENLNNRQMIVCTDTLHRLKI
jgi:hypothetical protein